ncbi:MAG: threonylcarbamoyl-AMP synthase [Ruminococcaceae bacterium]|nr:threonylcarbamoyl-AMP synthase [Oscillospiraceae bacterium]
MTQFFTVDALSPDKELIQRAAKLIQDGGLVAFPTETVYGLGANATDAEAAKKIYAAKGRPSDNPLIIHISRPEDAALYAEVTPAYERLARAFMPGPLTVILKKKSVIPPSVTGGLDTVAVRCPSHPVARALIEASGTAIAAPSANRSGSPSPTAAQHVRHDLDGRIDAIIDGGACEIGLESTIVALTGDDEAVLLRPGAVTYDALCCVLSHVTLSHTLNGALSENERPLSPGMKYKHYAPSAPLVLLDGEESAVLRYLQNAQRTERCAILCYAEETDSLSPEHLLCVGAREDLAAQSASLFAALRQTDGMNIDVVYAHLPTQDGLGLALYNRLIRAAAHTVKYL